MTPPTTTPAVLVAVLVAATWCLPWEDPSAGGPGIAAAAAPPAAAGAAGSTTSADDLHVEQRLRARAVDSIRAFVTWATGAGAAGKDDGLRAVGFLSVLQPDATDLAELKRKLEAVCGAAPAKAADDAARRARTAFSSAAADLDRIADLAYGNDIAARCDAALLVAYEMAPTTGRRKSLAAAVDKAVSRKAYPSGVRLLSGLMQKDGVGARSGVYRPQVAKLMEALAAESDPAHADAVRAALPVAVGLDPAGLKSGRYDAAVAAAAAKGPMVVGSPSHPMVALVTLPKGWTAAKTWPVLVAVEGAGCNFSGLHAGFAAQLGDRPYILVTPFGFSGTGQLRFEAYPHYAPDLVRKYQGALAGQTAVNRIEFDTEGLTAVLSVVRAAFQGEEKIHITGFSGGGILAYHYLLTRPSSVAAAAPACANFYPALVGAKAAPCEGGGPPVILLMGGNDPYNGEVAGGPGLEAQTEAARKRLTDLKFTRVSRRTFPGVPHDPLVGGVFEFCDEARKAGK